MLARWDLIEWDFDILLHRDLDDVFATKTWRWFLHRLGGLFSDRRSSIHATFTEVEPETPHG